MNSSGDEEGCFSSSDDEPPGLVETYSFPPSSSSLPRKRHADGHPTRDRSPSLEDHSLPVLSSCHNNGSFRRPERLRPSRRPNAHALPVALALGGTTGRQPCNPRTRAFRQDFFRNVSDRQWNDWRWQSRNRIRTLADFERMLRLTPIEREAILRGGTMLPVGVTPYYLSLLDAEDASQPLRRTVIPSTAEFLRTPGEADDPLGEDGHSPVPGLVHRYPDRVLLLALDFCSTYCRYCTRSRVVGHGEIAPSESRLEAILDYLRGAKQVRDVLISGGDPLAMSEDRLDWLLGRLRSIPHIEFVRIGTKMPVVLPQRITRELCRVLRKYHPLWMSVHFLHPDECTPEVAQPAADWPTPESRLGLRPCC